MATLFTDGKFQPLDASGTPFAGGKLYTYLAGTTTAQATYTTPGLTVPNANPVVLDSAGRASVWLGSSSYRMILKDASNVTVWDVDNVNGNASEANVVMYGATGDGTTDDRAAIQAAIDAMATAGGGTVVLPHPTNYYRISLALQARSGVTVLVPNNATRIVCTGNGAGAEWPIYGIWVFGNMSGANYDRCPEYPADAVTQGDESVTLTTAGDSENFAAGDVVAVETTSTYTVGSQPIPTWIQYNVVTSSASGVVGLRHAIDATHASVNLRLLTTDLFINAASGAETTYELQAVRDFSIIGGTWEASVTAAPWGAGGGLIDCSIRPHKIIAATGASYGNAFAYSTFDTDIHIGRYQPIELAFGSHNNNVRVGAISVSDAGLSAGWFVAMTEGARDNTVRIGSINGGAVLPTTAPVTITNSYRNTVDLGSIVGNSIVKTVALIQTVAYTGTNNNAYGNHITIGSSTFTSQLRYVQTTANTPQNFVSGTFYGTVTSEAMSLAGGDSTFDGYYENGAIVVSGTGNKFLGTIGTGKAHVTNRTGLYSNDFRHTTSGYKTFRALGYMLTSGAYTATVPLAKNTEFLAGVMQTGDVIKMRIRGYVTGAGTKTLTVTMAGTTVANLTGLTTEDLDLDIEFYVSSDSTIVAQVQQIVGSTVTLNDVPITGLTMSATAYTLAVATTGTDPAGSTVLRAHRVNCIRPFVESVVL